MEGMWKDTQDLPAGKRRRDRPGPGTGIAVRSGSRKLTECADAVCESPMDDGIYRELKRRGIISGENGTGESREKKAEERRA